MTVKPIYQIEELDERWKAAMLAIVRQAPIEANGMRIVFDHQPDPFLLRRLRSRKVLCGGFFIRGQLSGFALMLYKKVYVEGLPQTVLYFGNLVAAPAARGKGILYRMSDFFMNNLPDDIRLGHAVVMKGNRAALRLVNRAHPRFPNMPHLKIIGEWRVANILLLPRFPVKLKYPVRPARSADIDAIACLLDREYRNRLFGPVVSRESILRALDAFPNFSTENYYIAEEGGEVVGVCCAWDMGTVKQNRILRYGPRLKWLKRALALISPLGGYPPLPREGEAFRDVTILDYAAKERNPEILQALLQAIYRDYRRKRYHMMIFGYADGDPLGAAARPFFSREVVSEIVLFSKSKRTVEEFVTNAYPYIDMALL